MANASKNSMGKGGKGKGSGAGAMTTLPTGALKENMTLSNRDKSRRTGERGLDSRPFGLSSPGAMLETGVLGTNNNTVGPQIRAH